MALIVSGSLNGFIGLVSLLDGLLRLILGIETLPESDAERAGFAAGTLIGYGISLLTLAGAPAVIYGGCRMLSARSVGLSKVAPFYRSYR